MKSGTIKDKLQYTEGKTKKLRTIPLKGEMFYSALEKYWLIIKENKYRYNSTMFYMEKRRKPLNDSGVKFILREFINKRNITQCSPHSFRKGGARYMFENGVRIEYICDVLNHHSTRTTEIYINITPRDIENAMKCLEI